MHLQLVVKVSMLTNIVEFIYAHHSTKRWLSFFT